MNIVVTVLAVLSTFIVGFFSGLCVMAAYAINRARETEEEVSRLKSSLGLLREERGRSE